MWCLLLHKLNVSRLTRPTLLQPNVHFSSTTPNVTVLLREVVLLGFEPQICTCFFFLFVFSLAYSNTKQDIPSEQIFATNM